jgi:hypothetical protein
MADKRFVLNKLLEGTEVTIATPHFYVAMDSLHHHRYKTTKKLRLYESMWSVI